MIREGDKRLADRGISDLAKQADLVSSRRKEGVEAMNALHAEIRECKQRMAEFRKRVALGEYVAPSVLHSWEIRYAELVAKSGRLTEEMVKTKETLKRLNLAIQAKERESAKTARFEVDVLNEIGRLRDKYHSFASDNTRVNSMRLMASGFSEELTAVMRRIALSLDV